MAIASCQLSFANYSSKLNLLLETTMPFTIETVARLGIYQVAGSHKSYHALLKYCLNTKTVADSVIMIVLDWAKPWTFMETLERWIKVLEGALQQICQEGAVATATWTKGKALMDELQEKCTYLVTIRLCFMLGMRNKSSRDRKKKKADSATIGSRGEESSLFFFLIFPLFSLLERLCLLTLWVGPCQIFRGSLDWSHFHFLLSLSLA